jgi:hypothetical protein
MQPTGPTDNDATDPADPAQRLDTVDSAAAPPPRPRWWRPVATAGVAALALVAAGAFGAALADRNDAPTTLPAAASSTPEDGAAPGDRLQRFKEWAEEHGPGMLRGGFGPGPGFGPGHAMLGGVLHGSYVAADPDGGYRTVLVQRGEVTAVSDSSLTVVSEDDFTTTYRVDGDTLVLAGSGGLEGIAEGDTVHVSGVREDGTTRAVHVADLSNLPRWSERHEVPAPGPTTTTSSSADA